MNPMPVELTLHDIKPLMEVPNTSLYFFTGVVALGVLFAGVGGYVLWRIIRRRRKRNLRSDHYARLKGVDFSDPKAAAYAITRYGHLFAQDGTRYAEAYASLVGKLAPYKYRKTVEPIDADVMAYYEIYLGMIDA